MLLHGLPFQGKVVSSTQRILIRSTIFYRHFITQTCKPHIYDASVSAWRKISQSDPLKKWQQGQSLKIVSWNVDYSSPQPASRIAALLGYLQDNFNNVKRELVIFLQEICRPSLSQILKTEWLCKNFAIIGLPPPVILQDGMNRPARYFNLILAPRTLAIKSSWRLPLPSEMGRDALFVDIPRRSMREGIVRLCTTHLESLDSGAELRKKQLRLISQHLKDYEENDLVVCGVIGGDFNSIQDCEDLEPTEMGLTDAWTGFPELSNDAHLQFLGRREGHTWGHQASTASRFPPRRFDKFLYTGTLEIIPSHEAGGHVEVVRRLGIN